MSTLRRTRRAQRDRDRVALLAKLRMLEHDFVRTDRDRQVADRRLADALAVDPDFRPGRGVQVDDALRQIERDARRPCPAAPARRGSSVAERLADDLQLVPARVIMIRSVSVVPSSVPARGSPA